MIALHHAHPEAPARVLAPPVELRFRHTAIAAAAERRDGTIERRRIRVAVRLEHGEVGAQSGQHEREELGVLEDELRNAVILPPDLGHELRIGQPMQLRMTIRQVRRPVRRGEEPGWTRKASPAEAPRDLEARQRAQAVAEKRVRQREM